MKSKSLNPNRLAITLTLSFLLIGCGGDKPPSIWNGEANTKWYKESESEFTIKTAEQLAGFAKLVNEGNKFNGKTVKLERNIILNDTANWQKWASTQPANAWTPIGIKDNFFEGTFDGGSFRVSGIYIINPDNFQGLFGRITNGTIKNLGVTASYIKGDTAVGGLVGNNDGTVSNSYSNSIVVGKFRVGGLVGSNDGKINESYSNSIVTGSRVGGLVGRNSGEIINSYSAGTVTGDTIVGGFSGANVNGTISGSYSTATVLGVNNVDGNNVGGLVGAVTRDTIVGLSGSTGVGGFVGRNDGQIDHCYSTGAVTGTNVVGGLVANNTGSISNSYSTSAVDGKDSVGKMIVAGVTFVGGISGSGGLVGNNEGTISESYSTGMVTGTNAVGGLVANNVGSISNSYSTSTIMSKKDIVGGLVGIGGGKISNCYSSGPVTGKGNFVGGLAGAGGANISSSYYNTQASGQKDKGKGEGKLLGEMQNKNTFVGWDFDKIWGTKSTINNGVPYLLKNTHKPEGTK